PMQSSISRVTRVAMGIALGALGMAILPATAQAVTSRQDVVGGLGMPSHVNPVPGGAAFAGANTPGRAGSRAPLVNVPSCNENDLRNAVNSVATAGGTVNLRPGCVYTLTNPEPTNVASGFQSIAATVTINGNNDSITRASAASFRFFEIDGPNGNL